MTLSVQRDRQLFQTQTQKVLAGVQSGETACVPWSRGKVVVGATLRCHGQYSFHHTNGKNSGITEVPSFFDCRSREGLWRLLQPRNPLDNLYHAALFESRSLWGGQLQQSIEVWRLRRLCHFARPKEQAAYEEQEQAI